MRGCKSGAFRETSENPVSKRFAGGSGDYIQSLGGNLTRQGIG